MSQVRRPSPSRKSRPRFPWLLLILLLASIGFFWVWPWQTGPRAVQVEFEPAASPSPN